MLKLSPQNNLVYTFIALAVVVLAIGFLLFYFLFYQVKKVESVPNKKIEPTIIEINEEILNPNQTNMKGGENI